jgi:hypothetical protein
MAATYRATHRQRDGMLLIAALAFLILAVAAQLVFAIE